MPIADATPVLSATDVIRWLECARLPHLDRQVLAGVLEAPAAGPDHADLLARHGLEHERRVLDRLRAEAGTVAVVERGPSAVRDTRAFMAAGVPLIYQAALAAGPWVGYADFLMRVERPSGLGSWSYEALDAKLAHAPKPAHLLQLCLYSDLVASAQALAPEHCHLVLGDDTRVTYRVAGFAAYARRLRRRAAQALGAAGSSGVVPYPHPTPHCALCLHGPSCDARRRADDHLSLVAGIRRDQVEKLEACGVATVEALGRGPLPRVEIGSAALARLRHQARLQLDGRAARRPVYDLLAPEPNRGLLLLPSPSPGDVFFDIEGDPFFDRGGSLEYLLGVADGPDGSGYTAFWGRDRPGEKQAFESFVDYLMERRRRHPGLHVYHYATYEKTAVRALMARHATREAEVDDLLRGETFVDLYQVTRQAVRASLESYSLKQVRSLFMPDVPATAVRHGDDSIVAFERWLVTGDTALLEGIEAYNRLDCVSTARLHAWLLGLRRDADERSGGRQDPSEGGGSPSLAIGGPRPSGLPADHDPDGNRTPEEDAAASRQALAARGQSHPEEAEALRLVAHLVDYHGREIRPAYWAYYDRLTKDEEALLDDADAVAGLEPDGDPVADKRSLVHPFRFPPQELRLHEGRVDDPATRAAAGEVVSIDAVEGRLRLRRGPRLRGAALPRALVAPRPPHTHPQRAAVARVAAGFAAAGFAESPRRAAADLVRRSPPRLLTPRPAGLLQTTSLEEQKRLVADLDGSCLVLQGPPGSGKTWTGARLVVDQLRRGRRVGVAALSHKAIHNLLDEVERAACLEGVAFAGLKKGSLQSRDSAYAGRFITTADDVSTCAAFGGQLLAGTSWLFADERLEGAVDCLFVDEAGQVALADALAMSTASRNLVLLGDPQQLPHVTQGVHPGGAGVSVLHHLLGDAPTVDPRRGLFLERTWRMHPAICRFVSEEFYDGRLIAHEGCARQAVASAGLSGAGLRFLPVEHAGNSQRSVEEADAVGREVAALLGGGSVTTFGGATRPIVPGDILVVAPFNVQVRCLKDRLPAGVEVGTVDRFQGREGAVVFFSMASSSGEDVPRGLEFLFSPNRLNVAISRARCLTAIVASPRLLDARCRTVEQMARVNLLCRFAEQAGADSLDAGVGHP